MAARITSVPFTLSGTATIPGLGVVTGVSTSYSLQTIPATTTPATTTTTTARGPLIDPPIRVTTSSTSSSSVSSSSALPSSSSVSSSSSSSSSTSQRTAVLATSTRPSTTSTSTTSSSSRTSTSVPHSSATHSSSAASASASRAVGAAAAGKPGELSTLARSLIIAGATVGGLIILGLIVGFFLRRLRRKRRHEDEQLGSELQDQGGKGAYGGAGGYGTSGGWGAGNDDEDQYHEKPVAAGAAGFGSGGAFVNALGRDGRPASPAGPGALYGGGYAASDVSLHGQALSADHMGGGGAMYGVDVGGGNNYNGLGHGYPPSSPYYDGQQHAQAAPGQYLANQGQQQQPYGADAYSAYPAVPSTVALASAYPDQSYDNLAAPAQQYSAPSLPAAGPLAATAPDGSTPMRVVRGFQASLEDELPIQPFTTLNLLQTYDDGWCLCEDPETGRQGVVPRDCLAAPELVNGQMETGARALTPTAGRAASPAVASPLLPTPAGPPAPVVDEKRALAAAAAMAYASGSGSAADESAPVPYAEEDPNAPARPLPTLPPPSFSESNLAAQAESSGAAVALPANEYPREKAVALGAPLSATAPTTAAAAPPRLDLEFGAGQNAPASGSGLPRLDTASSLAVSERQERRSSLMDSIAAAGAYLEGNGAPAAHPHAQ